MTAGEHTAFALAYLEAEHLKAEEEARKRKVLEDAAREEWSAHIYDPLPYAEAEPVPTRMYEGTGIGFLYGLPGSERFGSELGDWRIIPGSNRP